jgi:hypothetical protein
MLSRILKTSFVLKATALAAVLASPAFANDGFGGLTATGLEFKDSPVQMVSEDLFLSLDKIKVSYVFRHDGDEDLEGEVIFPLPPLNLGSLHESEFALSVDELAKENIVGFTATVDGKPVKVKVDRIAVMEPEYDENRPQSESYDTPGLDVTDLLEKYDIPLSYDFDKVSAALNKLPKAAKDDLAAAGLAAFDDEAGYPLWSLIERYHWTQVFPHGKDLKVSHQYKAAPPGGIFIWRDPKGTDGEYVQGLVKKYCIDDGTQKAIETALSKTDSDDGAYWNGMSYYLDYVLKTARTWNGPIKDFKLTIDKGKPDSVISLCIDGIKKTGPTTFVVEKKDFTPDKDISILIVPKTPRD